MIKQLKILSFLVLLCSYSKALEITQGEYFIDTDPGVGFATAFTAFAQNDTVSLTENISVTGYSAGFHNLCIRFKADTGTWTVIDVRPFYIQPLTGADADTVIAAETFIDTDPGVGLGTAIAVSPVTVNAGIATTVSTTGYAAGPHALYLRAKNKAGTWTVIDARNFYIEPLINADADTVIAAETFIDTDPGVGFGTAIAVSPASVNASIITTVSTTGYAAGPHTLYFRAKNKAGVWTVIDTRNFYVQSPETAVTTITNLEYFLDTDPGVGLGYNIPVPGPPNDTVILGTSTLVPCVSNGTHYVWLRAKNNLGVWSVVEHDTLTVGGAMFAQQITSTGPDTVCFPSTVTMLADSAINVTYQWLDNGTPIGGATNATYTATTSGNYSLRQTCTASGGQVTSNIKDVVVNYIPDISFCPSALPVNNDLGLCTAVVTYPAATAIGSTPIPVITYSQNSGTAFPVGTTIVNVVATNMCGVDNCQFNVVVTDNELPNIINCPANINLNNDAGNCSAVASWTPPTAGDNCAIQTFTSSHNSGFAFPVGSTTVTYTATDIHSNVQACSFNVVVTDNELPVISNCPANISLNNDAGSCTAVATWAAPTTGDNCAIQTFTSSHNSGFAFPVGSTTVTYTATDIHSNVQACSFNVVVTDNELPVISNCPANINLNNDAGICSAVATWTVPTANDNCAIQSFTSSHTSGFAFPVGSTIVTYTATDIHSNVQTCSFNVVVTDNELPVISNCPVNISLNNDAGNCSAVATWTTPSAGDNCAIQTFISTHNSGFAFPVGSTTVTYTATDIHSNVQTCSFNVVVTDTQLPSITCPADFTTCFPSPALGTPVTGDNCGVNTVYNNAPPVFPLGVTIVIWTVEDVNGNLNTCQQTVTRQNSSTAATSILSSSGNEICIGGSTTLSVVGGTLGVNDSWKWYTASCGGTLAGTGTSITVSPAITTTYFVRAEGICGNTVCVQLTILVSSAPPSSTMHYTGSIAQGCVSAPASAFTVNAVANCTFYNWTSSQAGVRFNGNPSPYHTTVPTVNITFVSLPPSGSSGWSICVFGGNACGNTNTICTWVRATVSMPTSITGSVIGCPGSSGNAYSSSTVAGAASYQWSSTGGIVVTGNGAQAVTLAFPGGFVSGTLSVRGQTACGYNGPNRTITITANPVIPGIISGPSYPCPNASSSYSIAAVPGAANYTWTTSVPGAVVTGTSTSCSIAFPATIPAGSTVSVVANSSCPTSSATRSKGIATGLPGVPFAINGPASGQCGQTGVSYTINPVFGATGYSWTASCGTIVGPTNLSGISIDWQGSFTTCTLSVTATNACGSGIARTLVVFGAPAIPASISGNAAPCASSVEGYSASSVGATSYNWTVPAGATILGPANGASINVLWGATSGNITVTSTNACGTSGVRSLPCLISCRQSQVTGSASGLNAEVYPNPATEKATVKFSATTAAQYHLNMIDVIGRNVLSTDGAATEGINMIDLDLNKLAKGVYMLNIMSGDNNEQIRVVVE